MKFTTNRLPFENTPKHWKSQSRISGQAGEKWCGKYMPCPLCNADSSLIEFKNNKPVKDFYCKNCEEEYQLKTSKSFKKKSGKKITSSDFEKWFESISNNNQPNLLIIKYSLQNIDNIKKAKENFFNIDKNLVSLRGHRVFNMEGYVDKIFLVKKEKIDKSCLIKRKKLSQKAVRSGWQGSYLKIDSNKIKKIYPVNNNGKNNQRT